MGRKGFKGICQIGLNLYLINDDSYHIIYMLQINTSTTSTTSHSSSTTSHSSSTISTNSNNNNNTCKLLIIAGRKGIEGIEDNEIGIEALLSRPGRIQADVLNLRCYFGCRTNQTIRVLHLTNNFPVTTLPINLFRILPGLELDFNRILITPSGEKIILFDRKGPFILIVNEVLTSNPVLQLIHTPQSGIKSPLQAACFPILSSYSHSVWDSPLNVMDENLNSSSSSTTSTTTSSSQQNVSNTNDSNITQQLQQLQLQNRRFNIEKSLTISLNCCLAAAGSRIWLVPLTESLGLDLPINLLPDDIDKLNPSDFITNNNNNNDDEDDDDNNKNNNKKKKKKKKDSNLNNETKLSDDDHDPPPPLQTIPLKKNHSKNQGNDDDDDDNDNNNNKDKYEQISNAHPLLQPYLYAVSQLDSVTRPYLACKVEIHPRFLIHDMISISSNTIIVLNRHSKFTGLWQITTNANKSNSWEFDKNERFEDYYSIRYLTGKEFLAPHGMVISSTRKYILVVETGTVESEGKHGGEINLINIHLCNYKNDKQIRVSNNIRLVQNYVNEIPDWEECVISLRNDILHFKNNHIQGVRYEDIYLMDGERYEDLSPEVLAQVEIFKATKSVVKTVSKGLNDAMKFFSGK